MTKNAPASGPKVTGEKIGNATAIGDVGLGRKAIGLDPNEPDPTGTGKAGRGARNGIPTVARRAADWTAAHRVAIAKGGGRAVRGVARAGKIAREKAAIRRSTAHG